MNANDAAAMIVSTVQKSNLNFYIQESPFSLNINLRKSFIKNKNGGTILPHSSFMQHNNEVNKASEKLKVEKLELENSILSAKLQEACDALHENGILLEKAKQENKKSLFETNKTSDVVDKLQKENLALKRKNDDLEKDNEKLLTDLKATTRDVMAKNKEIIRLENKNNNLEEEMKTIKEENESRMDEITSIKNEKDNNLAVKEIELSEAIEEKTKLEKKVTDLLDVLYGCPECGCNSCECASSFTGENSEEEMTIDSPLPLLTPSAALPSKIPAPILPPPSSGSLWIPPPTPPCESCGGINFGPSPSSLCFGCIPPLESKTPSWTPPGTPPHQQEGKARIL